MSILTIHAPFLHKKLCKTAKHIKSKMQFHAKCANVKLSSFSSFTEANSSLFHRRYSIVTPSLLHRMSIVSMEYLWRYDGDTMEKRCRCYGPVMEQLRSNTQVAINNLNESSTKINAARGYMTCFCLMSFSE